MSMEHGNGTWGHCEQCRYFGRQGDPGQLGGEERQCHQPELEDFELLVTGVCGCNRFSLAGRVSPPAESPMAEGEFELQ